MKNVWLYGSVATLIFTGSAGAGTVFVSTLNGDNERPSPVATDATGTFTSELTGGPGEYVLSYTVNWSQLSSDPTDGHIHYAIRPPGQNPKESNGPIVEELDDFESGDATGRSGSFTGNWRFDDNTKPLTDELVDSLFDGELYVNIHSEKFTSGEIRGQLVRGEPTMIPLPAPLLSGMLGLGAAGLTALRFRKRRA